MKSDDLLARRRKAGRRPIRKRRGCLGTYLAEVCGRTLFIHQRRLDRVRRILLRRPATVHTHWLESIGRLHISAEICNFANLLFKINCAAYCPDDRISWLFDSRHAEFLDLPFDFIYAVRERCGNRIDRNRTLGKLVDLIEGHCGGEIPLPPRKRPHYDWILRRSREED